MIRGEIVLSFEAYRTILEKENLGDPHPTLVGQGLWYPPGEARRRDERVLAELRGQGLAAGNRASDDLLEVFAMLQRPGVEYYTYYSLAEDKRQRTVRAAAIGRDAILVRYDGDQLTIAPIPVEQLGIRLAVALPDTPAAQVHSLSCDNAELDALVKGKDLRTSKSVSDARKMKRWLDAERLAVGQLFAAVRDRVNTRHVTQAPMPCWFDTPAGRVLLTPDSNGWVNLQGADTLTLAGAFEQLEKALKL